jgi:predicted transposase/invertase (TIGR01784 family)
MNKKKNKKTNNTPHDALVKKAMEDIDTARELLEEYLPTEFKSLIDLSTLAIEKESYVEHHLKKKFSDMVYSVKTKNDKKAFVYCLLEHQATSDHYIALRLWRYSLLLLERYVKDKNKGKKGKSKTKVKLPLIMPLVLYNGKDKYSAPKNIWELFYNPKMAKKMMSEDYRLIDLQAMNNGDINYDRHISFLLYIMKHIHARDILLMLDEAMKQCNKAILIDETRDYIHIKLIMWYIDNKIPENKKSELKQILDKNLPNDSEDLMRTIAQAYIEEGEARGISIGEAKGRQEGKSELIKLMIQNGNSLGTVSKMVNMSTNEIKKLIKS